MPIYADLDRSLSISGSGGLKTVEDAQALVTGIVNILTTPQGTRPMMRSFGSRFKSLLQEPMTGAQRDFFVGEFVREINQWDTRVRLLQPQWEPVIGSNMVNLTLTFEVPALGAVISETVQV